MFQIIILAPSEVFEQILVGVGTFQGNSLKS